jgi:hypothetical protein
LGIGRLLVVRPTKAFPWRGENHPHHIVRFWRWRRDGVGIREEFVVLRRGYSSLGCGFFDLLDFVSGLHGGLGTETVGLIPVIGVYLFIVGSGGFDLLVVILLAFDGGPGRGSQGTVLYGAGIDYDLGWLRLEGSELDVEGGGAQDAE